MRCLNASKLHSNLSNILSGNNIEQQKAKNSITTPQLESPAGSCPTKSNSTELNSNKNVKSKGKRMEEKH